MAARIKAEEQALIEGLKAVPKGRTSQAAGDPGGRGLRPVETAAGSRGDRECCRADGRDLAADFGKNGKREEWELEHWDQWLNEIADKNEDAACGEKQEKQAEEELSAFTENNTKMPSLPGPMPVFSGMTSGVRLIRNQSWILEHQTQMDLFRKIQSRPKRTAPKYKFDLLRVHQPPVL